MADNMIPVDMRTAPLGVAIRCIISFIGIFGTRLIHLVAMREVADEKEGSTEAATARLLNEVEEASNKIDSALDKELGGISLGVGLLAILQVSVWALQKYMKVADEHMSDIRRRVAPESSEIDTSKQEEWPDVEGVVLRRKIRDDH